MRQLMACVAAVVMASGCSGSVSQSLAPTAPTGAIRADASFAQAGQQVSASPAHLDFNGCFGWPQAAAVTVTTNFAGTITAAPVGSATCTVSPASQDVAVTPGSGGAKTATFQVIFHGDGGCGTFAFTDKKGNIATVTTTSIGGGSSTDCL